MGKICDVIKDQSKLFENHIHSSEKYQGKETDNCDPNSFAKV